MSPDQDSLGFYCVPSVLTAVELSRRDILEERMPGTGDSPLQAWLNGPASPEPLCNCLRGPESSSFQLLPPLDLGLDNGISGGLP